ncbi:polyphosphate polymerase domain-containing protein [Roseburia sp. MSJ-14]|uniref:polyphosphate polymerase domain-containing protein n=1 Tax=Roseburia sp. MSJ-14 TaxID=2841514 RepID=UPI001C1197BE|nr:polyphosphate polymerase domain-containing protein [Roseburia sp. MSJ-14]MBU5472973.1 polyphosphate polymerase domain-containing protein [Roseburia sp. MSJ-14]
MIQKVFNRYEKKYMLTRQQYEVIRQRMEPCMEEDQYGLHTIRNIYYDTEDDELIRTSLEKPKYKEKFRVRCYGEPNAESDYFLEIKKKYKGIVNKRRIVMKPQEAKAYLENGEKPREQSQIFREVDYVWNHYQLMPKVYLAYDRIALFGKEDAEFRVTFDQNIRSRDFALTLEKDTETTKLLKDGYYLMEVKISNAMPLWFVKILTELEIHSTSFSKYGNVYRRNLEKNGGRKVC